MPVGSSLPILCLRRARPPSCESRVEPGFGVAAELGGGLALEPAANVGQRLARQRVAHCLRSEEHTSALQSLMRNSYALFCLKKTTFEPHIALRQSHKHTSKHQYPLTTPDPSFFH